MRNLVLTALAIAALCACGASSKEVAMAKSARYKGDKLEMFAATKSAVEAKYQLEKSDETALGMQTIPYWYSVEGLTEPIRNNDVRDLSDKSVKIVLVAELKSDGDAYTVKVTPVLARYNRGMPNLEPLKEGDASLPGWVQDKTDSLALDIHKALSKWEVQSVPGPVPPASSPGPEAPAAGSAAPAADGSAAPAPAPAQ
jgi:hypothetical protein